MTRIAPPRRLEYLFDLIRILVSRDMKLRYKRSVLGFAWSLLNPLAQLLVFSLVFRVILPLNIPNYSAFLFCGLLSWNWFQAALNASAGAAVDNRDLVRRPGFPPAILPVVSVTTQAVHYLLALPVLLGFLALQGIWPGAALLALLPIFTAQYLLTLGLAYLLATLQVSFRDTQYLLGIALLLGFYLTPVFYDAAALPARWQLLYHLNPMARLVEQYRGVLLNGRMPSIGELGIVLAVGAVLLLAGYLVFRRASPYFVEEL